MSKVRPAGAKVTSENGGWTITLPNLPVADDGDTIDEALDETVDALRDYAEAWSDHRVLHRRQAQGLAARRMKSPPAARKDHEKFCRTEGWTRRTSARGKKGTHHDNDELALPNGDILWTSRLRERRFRSAS